MEVTLRQEQIRMLYSYWRTMIYGPLCTTIIVAVILWPVSNRALLIIWLLLNFGLLLLRRHDLKKHANSPLEKQYAETEQAANIFRLYSIGNGILWGLLPVFFFHQDIEYFSLILVIHGGYVSAAMAANAAYDQKSFYGFMVPATILFVVGTFANGGQAYLPHVLLLIFYAFVIAAFASKFHRSMREQLELRIQNSELMADLTKQRDRAEQAMLAKNRFLAAASHDLRQPVHALGLFVGSLEPYLEAKEPKQLVTKIKQTNAALASLFHGLLDISKLDADVVENSPAHIELNGLFNTVLSEYSDLATQKSLSLDVHLPDDPVVHADPALLERIIRNLYGNAVNYTDSGTVTLSAERVSPKSWAISVSDTGKGIPENELENIFSEYHQLENPERDRQKGLGLGLAIVRRLCLLMNIQLKVESTPGSGSTFTIVVPEGDREQIRHHAPVQDAKKLADINVIVIDDEADILSGMQAVLESWGCSTILADSGQSAMQALHTGKVPDVIIADFRLRENESGLDVIHDIREEFNREIPAVLVTGDTAPERLQQAADAVVQVLHKPVEPDELKSVLAQLHGRL